MKKPVLVLLATLLLAAIASAQDDLPFFEEADCPFDPPPGVTCGLLIVPENHNNPNSLEIELAVAIIEAESATPAPEPVVYLEGGPGGSALFAIGDYVEHPIRQTHDLILIDQRGTGFSFPSLNCFEVEEGDDYASDLAACYARLLDEDVELSAYTSAQNAADINALRVALGYEQVNLWGISYGTRLGLTVLRDYPGTIRAAVLDSVFPPQETDLENGILHSLRAFDVLFEGCAADATCASAYPTLEADFFEMVEQFNDEPMIFEYDDGFELYDIELTGDMLLEAVFQAQYSSEVLPMLPFGIDLLAYAEDDFDLQDGYDILQGYYTPETWNGIEPDMLGMDITESDNVLAYLDEFGDISDAEGLYTSMACGEELQFNDLDRAYTLIEDAPEVLQPWLIGSIEGALLECETWSVSLADPIENEPVQSETPTLLVSGYYDPITPPSSAEDALQTLPNGQHVVFTAGAHGETGSIGCGAELAAAFFVDPAGPLPTDCAVSEVMWYTE